MKHSWWTFTYRGLDFISYESRLNLPLQEELDSILANVSSIEGEMKSRIATYFQSTPEIKASSGQLTHVNIASFADSNTVGVFWTGDASWGDMAVEFTIREEQIIDETWGD
ncbi:hypothetical protein ACFQY0_04475 [Haloferula chungangensis]|uniref:Halobacterial output domain-containing protein n=1 Tax=Haloferula chungangensis TaxID=1048331 RepID=A0ABW2L281_9BACT